MTSQIYKTKNDIPVNDWKKSGLKLPSVIRVHKIATLEKVLFDAKRGQIDPKTKEKVREVFLRLTN